VQHKRESTDEWMSLTDHCTTASMDSSLSLRFTLSTDGLDPLLVLRVFPSVQGLEEYSEAVIIAGDLYKTMSDDGDGLAFVSEISMVALTRTNLNLRLEISHPNAAIALFTWPPIAVRYT